MEQLTPQRHRELIKAQIVGSYQPLEKAQDTDLEKGGEGSKGGKVIGHTKSGKAIYEVKSLKNIHPAESHGEGFSQQDHKDAAEFHSKKSKQHLDNYGETDNQASYRKAGHHATLADYHKSMSTIPDKKIEKAVAKFESSDFSAAQEHQQLTKANILGSYNNADQLIEKGGAKMPIGTTHNGYKKVAEGKWQKVSEHGMTSNEHRSAQSPHHLIMGQSSSTRMERDEAATQANKHKEIIDKLGDKDYSDDEVLEKKDSPTQSKIKYILSVTDDWDEDDLKVMTHQSISRLFKQMEDEYGDAGDYVEGYPTSKK